jgi:hypothetical protein
MKYILKQPNIDDLCRRCGKEPETIQHFTAGCKQLAPTEYIKRHDNVAEVTHQELAEAAELIVSKSPYYKYTTANVLENDNFKLYWNRSIITDKTIPSNRPDISFMNEKTKSTFLIDIASRTHIISPNNNRTTRKIPRTGELSKCYVEAKYSTSDPIVISSMGVMPKSLSQSLKRLNLYPNTNSQMQNSVIRDTCSIVRKFLSYK